MALTEPSPHRLPDGVVASAPIDLGANEASGLAPVLHAPLLAALGTEAAWWTVLDDVPVERAIALVSRNGDDEAWTAHRLRPPAAERPKTEDAEAVARLGDWVYVVGSQYGSKDGPLQSKRSFLARFPEPAVGVGRHDRDATGQGPLLELTRPLQLARPPFLLHRLVNDALRRAGVPLLDPGPDAVAATVHAARRKALEKGRDWAWRLRWDDRLVNVEGAAFLDGRLLLGLRVPVTADGNPLVVALEDVERLFTGLGSPAVTDVWVVDGPGTPAAPAGVRDLHVDAADGVHVLTGNLDSSPDRSVLLDGLPEGRAATSAHWRATLPRGGGTARAALVRSFEEWRRIEGLAEVAGHVCYVADEDERVVALVDER